jgi:hypothetical protein
MRIHDNFSDEYMEKRWREINWCAAEKEMARLQREIAYAAIKRNRYEIMQTQKNLIQSPAAKSLAVRRVCDSATQPGVDGVKWNTDSKKMRAAYRRGTRSVETSKCTSHYIPWSKLYSLVQNEIRCAVSAALDMDAFVQYLQSDAGHGAEVMEANAALDRLKKRESELRLFTKRAFEQNAAGVIDDATFYDLHNGYQAELRDNTGKLRALEEKMSEIRDSEANARSFAAAAAKYVDAETLSKGMLLELIDKILVYDAIGSGKDRLQKVEIHFRFIGKLPQ